MPVNSPTIGIRTIGNVARIFEKIIAGHITGFFRLGTQLLPAIVPPPAAFVEERLQYDAAALLQILESEQAPGCDKLIGVTDVDLFIPIFSHVFGEARQNGRAALVSIFRLAKNNDGSAPAPATVYERAAKVAIHELGHLFNLVHCDDERCLMHFSGNLEELDRIGLLFCRYCRIYLQDRTL
jgi:archaemetzincin